MSNLKFNTKEVTCRIQPTMYGEVCVIFSYDGQVVHEVIRQQLRFEEIMLELEDMRKKYEI